MLYIDVAKGIGILLVIFGHMIPRGILWNVIYGFHMPMFIFCSGIFEKRSISWQRLYKLLLSYLCLSAVGAGVYFLIYEFGNIYYIKQTVFNVLVGGYSPSHGIYPVEALWYIPCLVLIILFWHLLLSIKYDTVRHLAVLCVSACGVLLIHYCPGLPMLFNLHISMLLLPFFYAASNSKSMLKKFTSLKSKTILIGSIITVVVYFASVQFNGEINIYRGVYGISIVLYYLNSILGIVSVFGISILIARHITVVSDGLQLIGKHTLIIMGIHQLLILLLRDFLGMQHDYPIVLFIVVSLLSFGISFLWKKLCRTLTQRRNHDV